MRQKEIKHKRSLTFLNWKEEKRNSFGSTRFGNCWMSVGRFKWFRPRIRRTRGPIRLLLSFFLTWLHQNVFEKWSFTEVQSSWTEDWSFTSSFSSETLQNFQSPVKMDFHSGFQLVLGLILFAWFILFISCQSKTPVNVTKCIRKRLLIFLALNDVRITLLIIK